MKAILLAAGHGTRLRPLTNKTPKCLVPIDGIPLMLYWFKLFEKHGITDILVNINYLPNLVEEFVNSNKNKLNVTLIYEEKLLGSLGTILSNLEFIRNEKYFWIFYADNLTNINLSLMCDFHISKNSKFTMGLFNCQDPKSCGIAELSDNFLITHFEEKPRNPSSSLANAGIYLASPEIFVDLPYSKNNIYDLGFDLLPIMKNKMYGFVINQFIIDIGTIDNYLLANSYIQSNPSFI